MTRVAEKTVGLFFLVVVIAGCSSAKLAIAPDSLKASQNVTVISYKASPIKIEPNTVGVLVPFGVLINTVQQASTSEKRGKLAESFNKAAWEWNPSLVTAEECVKVLKNSSEVSFSNIVMRGMAEMPGAEIVRKEDPRTFTETNSYWSSGWESLLNGFRKTNRSLVEYKTAHPEIDSDLCLEIFDNGMYFTSDEFHLGLTLKLSNRSTNERIAVGYRGTGWSGASYDMPELKGNYSFEDFEKRFRAISQKACTEVLAEMGLY